jgi:hypothetical protein
MLTVDVRSRFRREETESETLTTLAASAFIDDVRAARVRWVRHDGETTARWEQGWSDRSLTARWRG